MGNRFAAAKRFSPQHLGGEPGDDGAGGTNKYSAIRAKAYDGRSFSSKAERNRYQELLHLQSAGEIAELELQPIYHFVINDRPLLIPWGKSGAKRRARYTADFRYRDLRSGLTVVEEVKGMMTPDAALRIALMEAVHHISVKIVRPRSR